MQSYLKTAELQIKSSINTDKNSFLSSPKTVNQGPGYSTVNKALNNNNFSHNRSISIETFNVNFKVVIWNLSHIQVRHLVFHAFAFLQNQWLIYIFRGRHETNV